MRRGQLSAMAATSRHVSAQEPRTTLSLCVEVLDSFGMIDGGGPGRYLLPFDRFDATWKYCPDGEDTASKREWLQPRPNPAAAAAAGDKDPTEAAMPHNMFAGEAAAAICS